MRQPRAGGGEEATAPEREGLLRPEEGASGRRIIQAGHLVPTRDETHTGSCENMSPNRTYDRDVHRPTNRIGDRQELRHTHTQVTDSDTGTRFREMHIESSHSEADVGLQDTQTQLVRICPSPASVKFPYPPLIPPPGPEGSQATASGQMMVPWPGQLSDGQSLVNEQEDA